MQQQGKKELLKRLEGLDSFIDVLASRAEERRKLDFKKKETALWLKGKPYYYGNYAGTLRLDQHDETKVFAEVVEQTTGNKCLWKFDSLVALKHYEENKHFTSWKEFNDDQQRRFGIEFKKLKRRVTA